MAAHQRIEMMKQNVTIDTIQHVLGPVRCNALRFFEIALILVCRDHIARFVATVRAMLVISW